MKVEGIPERAVLFRRGLETGDIEILVAVESWRFSAHYDPDAPLTPRIALALETRDNTDPGSCRVHPLILTPRIAANLVAVLERQLAGLERPDEPCRT